MDKNLKDQDVLLVREKGSNELQVANMDKDGKVKSAKPDGENPDLLKIDKHGNILENFFENFMRQVKEPTRFEFFRVPAEKFKEVTQKLQDAFKNPDKPENKEFLDLHRIDPADFLKKQAQSKEQTQTPANGYAIDPNKVQWDKLEKFGITRESLEKTGNLDKLLNYQKTDLMPVAMKFEDETLRSDARLSLRKQEDGSFMPAVHLIRHKPDLERPYFGIQFTVEDKNNLLTTGNLGRMVDAEFKQGEKTPILLSLDKQTNELVAFRKDWLKVPDTYKGAQLNEEQKQKLGNGEKVKIEGMTSHAGNKFDGEVQFNADKRYFEPIFKDKNQKQNQTQNQKQSNEQGDAPKTFRKKELNEDQRSSLQEGKTVYVDGLLDKKGKNYSGYITLNKETGKSDFMFLKDYKDALAAGRVVPDDRHKTQVAVNSEGKTNETTKKVDKPLEKGQTKPTEKQTEKQEKEEKKTVTKAKGLKM
ncbi:MAG: hypothetical protein EZS26_003663 [Candidatus Ordinivivax streblomastigis]|uniref:DUF3945 domain-containing protein n=1 Tax=Candidatus Ordinivivax streblomastigis TaxID=2540710 RepID=A0A5M8NTV7_9BACT|nr:MAG: hypothetical protein EZS26_003663 [Candidatus Ordinivivax streblomastigis]